VDPGAIKTMVQGAFYPAPAPRHRGHDTAAGAKHRQAPAAIPTTGPQGGAVTAKNGIACVD
jgi:hypothetical protein